MGKCWTNSSRGVPSTIKVVLEPLRLHHCELEFPLLHNIQLIIAYRRVNLSVIVLLF